MKLRWALLLVSLCVAVAWCAAGVHAARDTELDVVEGGADVDADADDAVEVDAAPAPAVAGGATAKAKGKGKAVKAKAKAKKKPFDDFGLARAAAFKLPKRAIRVRGNARTHRLKAGKLLVRSRLPFTDAKAQRSAGVCKAGKCKLKLRAKRAKRAKRNGAKAKGKGKAKAKAKGEAKAKTAAEAFPKSALPPVPFTAEELKAAAKRAAKGHAFVQLTDGADADAADAADADADTDAALAAADADADSGADDAADEEDDAEAEAEAEDDSAAEQDDAEEGDAFVEAGAVAGRKGSSGKGQRKGKGKGKGKKAKAKAKKQRVPVLVSRPSALVRRRVKAQRVKALRGYARHVHANGARVHVITPHRRTVTRLVTTGKGKHRKQRLVTTVTKRKRKIELTALLEVTGNVLFGKRGDELKEPLNAKRKGKGKGKGKGKTNANAKHAATGTAFIENLLVLSKRAPAATAAAADGDDGSDPHAHGHGHTHQHQWRLVYDDVNDGWSSRAAACSTLRHKWAASPLPAVVPAQAFAGAGAATAVASPAATVQQTLTDLPEHSLIAVSGTFHFLGAWRGEVGFATVNGAHVWLDTFAAAAGDDIDASLPQQSSVPFRVVLPHTAHNVTIGFGSSLPADADGRIACWAFDDVAVSVMH